MQRFQDFIPYSIPNTKASNERNFKENSDNKRKTT